MGSKIPFETIQQRIYAVHRDTLHIVEDTYINTNSKCKFVDSKYGEFYSKPSHILSGHKHPKRGLEKIKHSIDEFKGRLPPYLTLDEATYVNISTKARFFDIEHDYTFWTVPSNIVNSKRVNAKRANTLKLTAADVMKRLPPHLSLVESTYIGTQLKAIFIDSQYGEWHTTFNRIQQGQDHPGRSRMKIEQTCLKKYGVKHSSQHIDIARKSARGQTKKNIATHWKTQEELECMGSYELATVIWLNSNRINFKWHPKSFLLKNGKYYIPNLYLPDRDLWIEIKGYFRKDAQEKWDFFRGEHPNSELWNQKQLLAMGIIG